MNPKLSLVVAVAENGVIGADGGMPWHLPADLAHFKRTTLGKPVLMGRRTFDEIGKALPGRRNLVLTRQSDYRAPGAEVVADFDAALALVGAQELMIIGGAQIYARALPLASRLYRTVIEAAPAGDTHFPVFDEGDWRLVAERIHPPDERNAYRLRFQEWHRQASR